MIQLPGTIAPQTETNLQYIWRLIVNFPKFFRALFALLVKKFGGLMLLVVGAALITLTIFAINSGDPFEGLNLKNILNQFQTWFHYIFGLIFNWQTLGSILLVYLLWKYRAKIRPAVVKQFKDAPVLSTIALITLPFAIYFGYLAWSTDVKSPDFSPTWEFGSTAWWIAHIAVLILLLFCKKWIMANPDRKFRVGGMVVLVLALEATNWLLAQAEAPYDFWQTFRDYHVRSLIGANVTILIIGILSLFQVGPADKKKIHPVGGAFRVFLIFLVLFILIAPGLQDHWHRYGGTNYGQAEAAVTPNATPTTGSPGSRHSTDPELRGFHFDSKDMPWERAYKVIASCESTGSPDNEPVRFKPGTTELLPNSEGGAARGELQFLPSHWAAADALGFDLDDAEQTKKYFGSIWESPSGSTHWEFERTDNKRGGRYCWGKALQMIAEELGTRLHVGTGEHDLGYVEARPDGSDTVDTSGLPPGANIGSHSMEGKPFSRAINGNTSTWYAESERPGVKTRQLQFKALEKTRIRVYYIIR